ncbi:MAG: cell wall hydrolase [Lachnospiraceae bacterium]|jgi:spore germination cell wall hydrolase CwlJ-like protein|nr:cell wall hydrolase [Lachnospiraceae bacterium]
MNKEPKTLSQYALRLTAILLAAALGVAVFQAIPILNTPIETEAMTTEEKIKQAEEEKKKAEQELKQTQQEKKELEQTNKSLRETLNDLNAELEQISANIARLEQDIATKKEEIAQSELELAEATYIKEQQYDNMKIHIKYLYERQEYALVDTLLSASSMAELLNYADFIEQLTEYDRLKLEEFRAIERKVTETRHRLNMEVIDLDLMLIQVNAEQVRVSEAIDSTASSIARYRNQISKAEQEMLEIEKEIKKQADDIEKFKIQLAEEIRLRELAKGKVWRNISDVSFAKGDRTLLANLIYCEAGSEPYAGQVAVGAVVINRMRSPVFPDTMVGVIYAARQFSPVASGRLALALSENRASASCYKAADEAMSGATNVGDCLFFRTPISGLSGKRIGGHVFY